MEGRKIGHIESHYIDFAVIIFQLKTVQPTEYCAPRGLFSRKPVRFEITAMIFESLEYIRWARLDSTAVSIFVVMLVELTNTVLLFVFVNSTNMTTNIETAALSRLVYFKGMFTVDANKLVCQVIGLFFCAGISLSNTPSESLIIARGFKMQSSQPTRLKRDLYFFISLKINIPLEWGFVFSVSSYHHF